MTTPDDAKARPADAAAVGDAWSRPPSTLGLIVGASRFAILLAIFGTALSAVTLLLYGTLAAFRVAWDTLTGEAPSVDGAKLLAVDMIELVDAFLLGTVLYIVALGLFELFIDARVPLPAWLRIDDLDDLKSKLLGVIVVLLAVNFLGKVVYWDGSSTILDLGAAVALVVAALAVFSFLGERGRSKG